jgi:hypothetical protein
MNRQEGDGTTRGARGMVLEGGFTGATTTTLVAEDLVATGAAPLLVAETVAAWAPIDAKAKRPAAAKTLLVLNISIPVIGWMPKD